MCRSLPMGQRPGLGQLRDTASLLALVGHEPFLTRLAALILFDDISQAEHLHLRKAGVMALRWPGASSLEWLIIPEMLART